MMERFMPIIKEAVVSGLILQATRRDHRHDLAGMGLIALSGIIVILALIFGSLAAFTWLERIYSVPAAYLIISLVLAALGIAVYYGGLRTLHQRHSQKAVQSRQEISRLVDAITNDLSRELAEPVRQNPKTSLAAAAIAGFFAGEKIH